MSKLKDNIWLFKVINKIAIISMYFANLIYIFRYDPTTILMGNIGSLIIVNIMAALAVLWEEEI
jgi:hypothetical protein